MAENEVVIVVRSKNETKAGFEGAKRDAEQAGDDAGSGFARRFAQRLTASMLGGDVAKAVAGGGGGGGGGGFLSSFFSSSLGAGSSGFALAPLIAPVVTEVVGLASGFAAAAAGAGSFYLLAHPALQNLQIDFAKLDSAQTALQLAQNKFAIDPTKATQKAVQTATLNLQAVQMSMGQDAGTAASRMSVLAATWQKVTNAFQPQAFKIFGDVFKIISDLLPKVVPLATAFASALDPLLQRFDKFTQSPGFRKWLGEFTALVGPATTAIGEGVGRVAVAVGKLFTIMSSKDVVHAINILFDTLAGFFNILAKWITGAMRNWDQMIAYFKSLPASFAALGHQMMAGLLKGIESVPVLDVIFKVGKGILSTLGHIFHFGSPSRVMYDLGRNVTEGFRLGLQENTSVLRLGGAITGGGASPGAAPAAAGGGLTIRITGNSLTDRMLLTLLRQSIRSNGGLLKVLGP